MYSYLYPRKNLEIKNEQISSIPRHKLEVVVGRWGKMRKCKKGSFAIGAEVGLHDDYGLSNLKAKQKKKHYLFYYPEYLKPNSRSYELSIVRASVLNLRLYCSEYQVDDLGVSTTRIEGDLSKDFEMDPWMSNYDCSFRKKRLPWSKCERDYLKDIHRNQM